MHESKHYLPDQFVHSDLGQGSFTGKVRTIFTLKIIVSIFVKLFSILVLHLRQFFIVRIFVKRSTGFYIYVFNSNERHPFYQSS
jgi:hypothetical protein